MCCEARLRSCNLSGSQDEPVAARQGNVWVHGDECAPWMLTRDALREVGEVKGEFISAIAMVLHQRFVVEGAE